jgi:hypothetical protein
MTVQENKTVNLGGYGPGNNFISAIFITKRKDSSNNKNLW